MKDIRDRRFTIRFTETEYIDFTRKMEDAGYKSIARYIRDSVLGRTMYVPKKVKLTDRGLRDQLNAILASIQKIGVNYNQVVKVINTMATGDSREDKPAPSKIMLRQEMRRLEKMTMKVSDLMDAAIAAIETAEDKIQER